MATRSPRGRDPRRGGPAGPRTVRTPRTPVTSRTRTTAKASAPRTNGSKGSGPQITTRAVLLVTVVLLLIGSYTGVLRAWWSGRQEISTSEALVSQLKRENAELEDQKVRFDDPAYIKQQARERFGWVMPGEIGYRVIGSDGEVRGEVPTLDAPAEPKPDEWYDKLWGSVATAGRPAADRAPKDTTGDVLEDE